MKRLACSALVVLLGVSGVAQQGDVSGDFEHRREAARAELLKDLEGYADWCQGNNLFHQKALCYELVLELDPEHPEALKHLGYTRGKDGAWSPPEKPKTYRDFDKKALAEAPARWKAATAGYVERMIALLESGTLDEQQKDQAASEALRFDPEAERVHRLLGEVQGEKGWVLPETVRAKERRAVLRGHVRAALEQAPPSEPVALLEREQHIPLHLQAVAAPGLRVVGTADLDELRLCAQAVLALRSLLQAVFESTYWPPGGDLTVWLLKDPTHLEAFLEHHPAIAPERRAWFQKLEGGGIQGTNEFAWWTGDTQRRIDGIGRLVMGFWLSGAFGITSEQGFVYEGFGLYLTRSLVRSRMTWLAQPSAVLDPEQDMALRQRLIDPATNWMDEALRLVLERRLPDFATFVSKGASELDTEDVLYAYALATYLLEARWEQVPGMLSRIGRGVSRAQAFQETVGMSVPAFERHFERWLKERI